MAPPQYLKYFPAKNVEAGKLGIGMKPTAGNVIKNKTESNQHWLSMKMIISLHLSPIIIGFQFIMCIQTHREVIYTQTHTNTSVILVMINTNGRRG